MVLPVRSDERGAAAVSASEYVARPEGELDIDTVPQLAEEWLKASEELQPACFIIDLGAVTFLDSSALSAIVAVNKRQCGHGGELVVTNATARLAKIFRLTGLDGVLGLVGENQDREGHSAPSAAPKRAEG